MSRFLPLYLSHVFSYVEQGDIPSIIQINKKCMFVCINLSQRLSYECHLTKLSTTAKTLQSLVVLPSRHNGDNSNDSFIPFDYHSLNHLKKFTTLRSLTFSYNATTNFHLFSSVLKNITPNILTKIDLGTYDNGPELISRFVQTIVESQSKIRVMRFWKDPGEEERYSEPHEVQLFSKLTNLVSFRCFSWSPTFTSLVNLSHLNIYFHTESFNDAVEDFMYLPNLRLICLRSSVFKTFSTVSSITKLTQLRSFDFSGTQIVKDPQVFTLSNCTHLTSITIYYIDRISEDLFRLLKYIPQFHIQLQLYTVPLDNQTFPPFHSNGPVFDPSYLQILHTTFVQRKLKHTFVNSLAKRFKQWSPFMYIKGYDGFDCTSVLGCPGISSSLLRLELHFVAKLRNLSSINNLTLLTALTLRHCYIDQEDKIELDGLHSLQRLSVSDCFHYYLLSIQSIPSLSFVSLNTQFSASPFITQFKSLKRLQQVALHHIQCVSDQDLSTLITLDTVQHFTFDKGSIFESKMKYFATPTRTVTYVTLEN
ncbi:F-box domain-containing protein [Entamoeba marina]